MCEAGDIFSTAQYQAMTDVSCNQHHPKSTNKNTCSIPARVVKPPVQIIYIVPSNRVRGSFPGLGGSKETRVFLPHPLVKLSIVGNLRDREVACSASDLEFRILCLEGSVGDAMYTEFFYDYCFLSA